MKNLYKEIGCSQEDHLPNCGHFGYTGEYLSSHSEGCPAGDKGPCICNPKARKALSVPLDDVCKEMCKMCKQNIGVEKCGDAWYHDETTVENSVFGFGSWPFACLASNMRNLAEKIYNDKH